MKLAVTILAAGQGSRMRSDLPKVLHPLAGKPMLQHVIAAARALDSGAIHVVYGHGGDTVRARVADKGLNWIEQRQQLGTGDAVAQVMPHVTDDELLLVLYGDVPLVRAETLRPLVDSARAGRVGLLTAQLDNPAGYGRIVRENSGNVVAIVEEKDASAEQKRIREINTGLLAAPVATLRRWLANLSNDNAQGEYYLTDIIAAAAEDSVAVDAHVAPDLTEVTGVNDRVQLAALERAWQVREAERLMREGLTLADPARFDLRGTLEPGRDCFIDVNAVLEGEVKLGDRVRIGPNCYLRDVTLGDDVVVQANSVVEGAQVGAEASIGPFARIRPTTTLGPRAKVGNFVEVKQAQLEQGAKVNHLSYIGDAEVGRDSNIGAGTITCNYDGANKHRTVIGASAFIGSGTELVAPVKVGKGATVGAGSTVTKDVPDDTLGISRARMATIPGWKRPQKK